MKHHEIVVIRCDDIGARCGDVGARYGDACVWGSDVSDRAEVIRCDDIGARCGDVGARCGDVGARYGDVCVWGSDVSDREEVIRCDDIGAAFGDVGARRGDVGDRAELLAISARSYWRYRRGVSGNIGDCGVGVTPQMCNRVTNHGDKSTFSKPVTSGSKPLIIHATQCTAKAMFVCLV